MKKTGSRKNARETAFKMIFQMDVGKNTLSVAEETLNEAVADGLVEERDRDYVLDLVAGVAEKKEETDAFMAKHAKGWTVDRINAVEKNLIRLALYEIFYLKEIPYEVSVNEAVELAKSYGDEDAYGFVNAVLDNARPEKADGEKLR